MILFTSSWDDGSVYDMKLAELLKKYRQNATFYIPLANKKRDVITPEQVSTLANDFEIGAHTLNHRYLTLLDDNDAVQEIMQSKTNLEEITGKPVNGFCFPGGRFRDVHIRYAREAGYKYVRTTNLFRMYSDSFIMNTTLQAFNHTRTTYFGHLVKRGNFTGIYQNAGMILQNMDWDKLLTAIVKKYMRMDPSLKISVIHLWGHSYELQANNSWKKLENLFSILNDLPVLSGTNFDAFNLSKQICHQ